MGDCNPACQKIIINSGFVAPIADLLSENMHNGSEFQESARRLANTARAYVAVYEHAEKYGTVKRIGALEWDGCDHAQELMAWVGQGYLPENAAGKMDAWSDELEAEIRKIVSGSLR